MQLTVGQVVKNIGGDSVKIIKIIPNGYLCEDWLGSFYWDKSGRFRGACNSEGKFKPITGCRSETDIKWSIDPKYNVSFIDD